MVLLTSTCWRNDVKFAAVFVVRSQWPLGCLARSAHVIEA